MFHADAATMNTNAKKAIDVVVGSVTSEREGHEDRRDHGHHAHGQPALGGPHRERRRGLPGVRLGLAHWARTALRPNSPWGRNDRTITSATK